MAREGPLPSGGGPFALCRGPLEIAFSGGISAEFHPKRRSRCGAGQGFHRKRRSRCSGSSVSSCNLATDPDSSLNGDLLATSDGLPLDRQGGRRSPDSRSDGIRAEGALPPGAAGSDSSDSLAYHLSAMASVRSFVGPSVTGTARPDRARPPLSLSATSPRPSLWKPLHLPAPKPASNRMPRKSPTAFHRPIHRSLPTQSCPHSRKGLRSASRWSGSFGRIGA